MIKAVASILLIHLPIVFTISRSLWSEAQDLYNNGMTYIQEEDLVSGVAFIRAACRRFNNSALLWNDLGIRIAYLLCLCAVIIKQFFFRKE